MAKACEVCGTPFEGIAQRRYCSDACRVRASRRGQGAAADDRGAVATPPVEERRDVEAVRAGPMAITERPDRTGKSLVRERMRDHETGVSLRSSSERTVPPPAGSAAAEPPRRDGEAVIDYFARIRRAMTGGRTMADDSTEILRRERERRTEELLRRSRS